MFIFKRKKQVNPAVALIERDIKDIKVMEKQYEETRKQLLKNLELIKSI